MKRVRLTARYSPLILLQILFLSIAFSSFAQTKQSYRNHEEIDIGNGMKVEILKCTGDGPTEECDCIYFTDKRQNGNRMKVAASTIKEEERAANLAKNINKPGTRKSNTASVAADSRIDKVIPSSMVPKAKVPGAKQPITLEEAVKQADSVAAVSSKRINEQMAKEVMPEDSTDVSNTAAAIQTAVPALNINNEKTVSSSATLMATTEKVKEVTAPAVPEKAMKPLATPKDTLVNTVSSAPSAADNTHKNVSPVTKDSSVTAGSTAVVTDSTIISTTKEIPFKGLSADSVAKESAEVEEQTYVKQYGNLKKPNVQSEQAVVKTLPKESPVSAKQVKAPDDVNKQSSALDNGGTPVSKPASSSVVSVAENKLSAVDSSTQTVTETSLKEPSNNLSNTTATDNEKMNIIGRSAEVNVKGTWVNATIIDKETEFLYKVHYHGKSNEEDEWVAVSQIRNIDTAVYKSTPKKAGVNKVTESKAIENKAAERKEAEAKAAEIKAIKIKETEKKLAESKALELKAEEAKAAETKAAQIKEFEKKLAESKASELKTKEAKAAEIKAAEVTTEEKKTAESKALEAKAAESKPAEDKLSVSKATEMKATENKSNPVSKPAVYVNCSFDAPASVVYNSQPFTEKVAKRKIYDNYMVAAKANSSVKTGVTFLSFKAEEPYVNTVTVSATGNLEVKLPVAPAGALIYPVQAEYKVCEQVLGKTSSKTMDKTYVCFRNKEGAWTCEMTGQ